MDWYQPTKAYGPISLKKRHNFQPQACPIYDVTSPSGYDLFESGTSFYAGDKFYGGFGQTKIFRYGAIDYWTLRERSLQLYVENEYAKGLIDRLVTNIINTGLKLQATPEQNILGLTDEEYQAWTEDVEQRFELYTTDANLIDWMKLQPFSQLQAAAKLLAFLSGDCLIVLHVTEPIKLPQIQIIDGSLVQSPIGAKANIKHGVELDSANRQIAYWVNNKRIPAFGRKSKRRIAWMLYGSKRLAEETRGLPLLSCCLQALKEIDRYKDSELRAAWVNSLFALFVTRDEEVESTQQLLGRAGIREGEIETVNDDNTTKQTPLMYGLPGIMIDKLAPGEKIVSHDTSRPNINFKDFARAILSGIAWSQGLPPEILFLEFQNNFSASRQASIEFKTWLNQARLQFSEQFNTPFYVEWLTDYALQGKLNMPGYIEALRDPKSWEIRNAWRNQRWLGVARPSVDPLKEIKAWVEMINAKIASREEAAQELMGTDWLKTLRRIEAEENKMGEREIASPMDDIENDIADIRDFQNG